MYQLIIIFYIYAFSHCFYPSDQFMYSLNLTYVFRHVTVLFILLSILGFANIFTKE